MHKFYHKEAITTVVIILLLVVTGSSGGCFWTPSLTAVRKEIEQQLPSGSLHKKIELTIGPIPFMAARLITGMVPEAREASPFMANISSVEIAVYETSRVCTKNLSLPAHLRELQEKEGWEMAVKIRDDEDLIWLLYRIDDRSIGEVFAVALSDGELVIVKVKGRLEKVIAYALAKYRHHIGTT
jgi:hypothetical protein